MTVIHSFPPLAKPDARILILGSMPGKASLQANEYYAYARNAFWKIMQSLLNLDADLSYAAKCAALCSSQIAVWDVLKSCTRTTSLDSDIVESSIVPNDLRKFFAAHRHIRAIYFNGAKAAGTYHRYVLPNLPVTMATLPAVRLPSTSPANASLRFEEKLEKWQAIVSTLATGATNAE